MNIVFMGTPEFSVPCLDALIKAGHNILGVLSITHLVFTILSEVVSRLPLLYWWGSRGLQKVRICLRSPAQVCLLLTFSFCFSGFCLLAPFPSPSSEPSAPLNSCLSSSSLSAHLPSVKWSCFINKIIIFLKINSCYSWNRLCSFWIQSSTLFDCPHLTGCFSFLLYCLYIQLLKSSLFWSPLSFLNPCNFYCPQQSVGNKWPVAFYLFLICMSCLFSCIGNGALPFNYFMLSFCC